MIRVKPSQIKAAEQKFGVNFKQAQAQRDSDQWPQAYWDFYNYLAKHYSVESSIRMQAYGDDGRPIIMQPILIDDLSEPYDPA